MTAFEKPVQLPENCGIDNFHCGDNIVDKWVLEHSATARKRGTAVIYASYSNGRVAGFYTLSTHSVRRADVAGGWLKRNAADPIPCVLLGMLGVDDEFKGVGLGSQLLRNAIENALKIADLAGAKALIVDPTGPDAEGFYAHFGFTKLPGTSRMAIRLHR